MTARPITRRQALQLGALGLAGVVIGGAGLSRTGLPWSTPGGSQPGGPRVGASAVQLTEPTVLRSDGGRLQVELVAAQQDVELAGRRARALTYNGQVPGPTLRLRPGDVLEVRLTNNLGAPTNLHTHGLHVSPQGHGDNALLSIEPGQVFDYRFELPEDHPTGVFWYHPHRHGLVANQIFGGLYGAVIVEDDAVPADRERILLVSDISLDRDGSITPASAPERMVGREGDLVMVNGQLQPEITARSGERERWRVINACTARYLRLALPGQTLQLLGTDSGHEPQPRTVEEVLLAPGNRADLLVTMGPGTAELQTLGYDRGAQVMSMMGDGAALSGPATLASVTVAGGTDASPVAIPGRAPDPDLRGREPDRRREITFTMGMTGGMGAMSFGFDGQGFDPERVDQDVRAGALEEWTIRNPTPMDHPFHLHVWPMQMIQHNGDNIAEPTWRDVINIPAGGQVRVRIDFSRFAGRTVYHCHILDHEDAGMMGIVQAR
ncbi:multicopper oxidase family protein [Georgenia yuyongxinii]